MIGKNLPKPIRVNLLSHWLGCLVAWITGWRLEGEFPNIPKFVIIVAPHTSNWDLPTAVMLSFVARIHGSWMGKHSIFWPPLSWILRGLGGFPVERSSHHGLVKQAVDELARRDIMVLGLAPEVTRSCTEYWKSGFYQIALHAGVPVVPCYLDYQRGIGCITDAITLTGHIKTDMDKIRAVYASVIPRHPELQGPLRIKDEDDTSLLNPPQ
jgi:1-acyl-sn-glycerol-3-phosphate acyltransferase